MTVYDNASTVRSPKMGWMRHSEWAWYITLVDHSKDMRPAYTLIGFKMMSAYNSWVSISIGCDQTTNAINGPNK